MALEQSTSEDEGAASSIKEVNTDESEDIDLAALMERYQGSLSVSISDEECKSLFLKQGESEDEFAARANEIMQRYKMQYALSEDTEQVEKEMGSNVNSELVENDVLEQGEPSMLETESYEVEIGEEIQEEEVEASNASAADAPTRNSATKVEASSNDADESKELEEMVTKLTLENEALKKKKVLKKRIYELSQENDKLKRCTQRNALANIAVKFDDAVNNAVAKVSKMVCKPDDADIFEGGFPEMSEGDENGDCVLDSEPAFGRRLEYKHVEVLSPISHMTENTNYFQSAQAPSDKYQPIKPKSSVSVSVNDVLEEARLASGVVTIDDWSDDASRRVEEAKRYIKNSVEALKRKNVPEGMHS